MSKQSYAGRILTYVFLTAGALIMLAVALLEPPHERIDRLRLVARRLIRRMQLEIHKSSFI